ncbi:MAG: hypothetical protein IK064_05305, partial [Clostridia bacterium]|nr:hypothetical protein [Clostridia bacterium]
MNTKLMRLAAAIMGLVFLLSAFACTGRNAGHEGQDAIVTAEPTAAPATNVPTTEAPATDEPTAAPTEAPEPTEEPISYWVPQAEWFIDEAFPVIERIGAVHGLRFSKADSSAQGYMQYSSDGGYRLIMNISFFGDRPCTALAITAYPDNFGEYTFSVGDVFIPGRFEDEEAWRASYPEEVWRDLNDLSDSARFIITPEEIAGSGCTETEGEEYLLAVGRCYQQKLAEFFRNLPENYPCSCIDM